MSINKLLSERLDAMMHPSAGADLVEQARHRAFMAPRLLVSLGVFFPIPALLAFEGAPSAAEAVSLAWLVLPILLSAFLSRTGRYDAACMLSSASLGLFAITTSAIYGGFGPTTWVWLVIIPLEAALSSSRQVFGWSAMIAVTALGVAVTTNSAGVSAGHADNSWTLLSLAAAVTYAAGTAFAFQSLTKAQAVLRGSSESLYRLLTANMNDMISCHRSNGMTTFVSPAAQSLLGVAPSRLHGHALFDHVHVADRPAFLTAISNAAQSACEQSLDFRLRRQAAGHPQFVWVEMRCRPFDAPNADAEIVAVMRDVTERKRHEEALDRAHGCAAEAEASKTRFLTTMSHELRTPLNAIIGFSEIIARDDVLTIDAERRREYAHLIHDSGRHLLSVVNGILDMSKLESGNFEISPEPFSPCVALVSCCNLLALKARDGGVDLVTRASESLPDIEGDARAFKQIVINLVSNAIKFTDRGGIVTVSANVESARLVLRVCDNGVGIAADDLKRIGDPFFQADTGYQRRQEGTGLGLSIVKSLVSLHDGEMSVQSRIGEGTTVVVALPLLFSGVAKSDRASVTMLVPSARVTPFSNEQAKKIA